MDKFFDMPVVVDLLAFYLDSAIDIFPNYHKWSAWSALFLFYFQLLIIFRKHYRMLSLASEFYFQFRPVAQCSEGADQYFCHAWSDWSSRKSLSGQSCFQKKSKFKIWNPSMADHKMMILVPYHNCFRDLSNGYSV